MDSLWDLWWRIRYAYWFRRTLHCNLKFAWQSALAAERIDDDSPRDAVDSELSYWSYDG